MLSSCNKRSLMNALASYILEYGLDEAKAKGAVLLLQEVTKCGEECIQQNLSAFPPSQREYLKEAALTELSNLRRNAAEAVGVIQTLLDSCLVVQPGDAGHHELEQQYEASRPFRNN